MKIWRWMLAMMGLPLLAQAQTTPVVEWTHDGVGVTYFELRIDDHQPTNVGLPLLTGSTYSVAMPTLTTGQHTVHVRACDATKCSANEDQIVVKVGTAPVVRTVPAQYATIQSCLNVAVAGDTCLVSAGNYESEGRLETVNNGTATNRITLKAATGATVYVRSIDFNTTYNTVDGLTFQNDTGGGVGVFRIYSTGSYCEILNNTIGYSATSSLYVMTVVASGSNPTGCIFKGNTVDNMPYLHLNLGGSNFLIEDNDFRHMKYEDYFRAWGTGHIIRRNKFWYGWMPVSGHGDYSQIWWITGGAKNVTIEENWFGDNPDVALGQYNTYDTTYTDTDHSSEMGSFIWRRNVFAGSYGNWSYAVPGSTFDHNTFFLCAMSGIGIGLGTNLKGNYVDNTTITNNVFLACGNTPTQSQGETGWYSYGHEFGEEAIDIHITKQNLCVGSNCTTAGCQGSTTCAIRDDLVTNGYLVSRIPTAAACALTNISQFTYTGPDPATWETPTYNHLVETCTEDALARSTFTADYNYVAGYPASGYPAKKTSSCSGTDRLIPWNFCEGTAQSGHGKNGSDPLLLGNSGFTTGIMQVSPGSGATWTAATKNLYKLNAFTSYIRTPSDTILIRASDSSRGEYAVDERLDASNIRLGTLLKGNGISANNTVNFYPLPAQSDLLGADGIPLTMDDGLKPSPSSILCGASNTANAIGAYSCDATRVFDTDVPAAPASGVVSQRRYLYVGPTRTYTTIQACANVAVAGDTCLIDPGTYDLEVYTVNAGTANARITYMANNGTVTLPAFRIQDEYITLSGLTFSGYTPRPTGNHSDYGPGQTWTANVRIENTGSHAEILNCTFRNATYVTATDFHFYGDGTRRITTATGDFLAAGFRPGMQIYVGEDVNQRGINHDNNNGDGAGNAGTPCTPVNPPTCYAYSFQYKYIDTVTTGTITLASTGYTTQRNGVNVNAVEAAYLWEESGVRATIYATGEDRAGVKSIKLVKTVGVCPSDVLIKGNTFSDSAGFIVNVCGDNHTITYNTFTNNNGWRYITWDGANTTISHNLITNATRWSTFVAPLTQVAEPGAGSWDMYDALFQASPADLPATNTIIEYNFISGIDTEFAMVNDGPGAGQDGLTIRYNVFYDYEAYGPISRSGTLMEHNTFYKCSSGRGKGYSQVGDPHPTTAFTLAHSVDHGDPQGSWIKNNTFVECGFPGRNDMTTTGWYSTWEQSPTQLSDGVNADYNHVAGPGPTYASKTGFNVTNNGITLEAHGQNGGDPHFRNPTNPLGPDGLPFTADDGLIPLSNSPLCKQGENGTYIGAYACGS